MIDELNATQINDAEAFMAEFDAQIKKGNAEYRKMLRQLCPSKDMRKQARRISNGKHPCYKCAYYDKNSGKCLDPHSALYNMFIEIDHCYEGVLRYLAAEAEKAREADNEAKDALIDKIAEALEKSVDISVNSMGMTRTFARWIIMMTDGNWKMPLDTVKCVREILDWLNGALPTDKETAETGRQ